LGGREGAEFSLGGGDPSVLPLFEPPLSTTPGSVLRCTPDPAGGAYSVPVPNLDLRVLLRGEGRELKMERREDREKGKEGKG